MPLPGVLHKRNGHVRPVAGTPTPGKILRLVDADRPGRTPAPRIDDLRFAHLVQSEKLWSKAGTMLDSLQGALAEALGRTKAAFERGELDDIRATLEAFESRAREAARMIARLAAATRGRSADYRLVDMNALVAGVADLRAALDLAPDLPCVIGVPAQLQHALQALASFGGPVAVRLETHRADGVLQGEPIVRVTVTVQGGTGPRRVLPRIVPVSTALEPPDDAADEGLARASWVVAEHGGVITTDTSGDEVRFTLELPGV